MTSAFPDEFAGLWVDRDPKFHVVVAMTTDKSAEIRRLAAKDLLPILEIRQHPLSLAALQDIAAGVRAAVQAKFNLGIDIRNNDIFIEVLPEESDAATSDVLAGNFADRVRLVVVPTLGGPTADIYGGLTLSGGIGGTSGFSVQQTGVISNGIVTAGHLSNTLSYNGINLPYQAGSTTGNLDAQWHYTASFTAQPKFKCGSSCLRNVTSVKSYASTVVGGSVCKYGVNSGYTCGTVEMKTYEPSWITNSNPVFVLVVNCGVDIVNNGDSGGPVFLNYAAYGIVSGSSWGGVGCWADKLVYNSATHFQSGLSISIKIS